MHETPIDSRDLGGDEMDVGQRGRWLLEGEHAEHKADPNGSRETLRVPLCTHP